MNRYLLLIPMMLLLAACKKEEEAQPKPVVAVKTAKAEVGELQLAVAAPATIFAREQANVSGRTTAPIRLLKVKKGDSVHAGDVMAVLENKDVEAQRMEARAALADAEANLARTQAGTLPSDVEHARGLVETSDAALALAKKVYERRAGLFKEGAIPQRDLQQSETEMAQAKTNADVARRSLELLQKQSGAQDVVIAQTRVAQARARLDQAEAQSSYAEIRSPFTGTVTEQFMYPGDMAKPDAPTFTVMDLSAVTARAQVPEERVSIVRQGQACVFAPTDAGIEPVTGRVSVINKAVDAQRRSVEVWCEIDNSSHKLRGSIFGQLRIVTGKVSGVVAPLSAVQFNEGTRAGWVMVVDEKKIAHKRDIEGGEPVDGKVPILKGLNAGETIIVEAVYGIPDGTEVKLGEDAKKPGAEEK